MSTTTGTALPHPPLARGSEWGKWDLHVHSPLSAENQFPYVGGKPDWEAYISKLESLADFSAVAITDYFSIEGYTEVRRFRNGGRLKNLPLILPNIELRLDVLVPTSGDAGRHRRINVHVIFSDEISSDDLEQHFLSQVEFTYLGAAQGLNEKWCITRKQLEALGTRLKSEQPDFKGSDFAVGCTNATVNIEQLKRVLQQRPTIFKDRYLIVLAEENTSLISWKGQGHQTRKVLLQSCDAIFSANANTRDWALGGKHDSPEEFKREFGSLKPCLHGSDAHDLDKIGVPDENRFCWIKADPTFEGLKQVLYEPEERVFIGDKPLNLKNEYQVIDSLGVVGAPDWFSNRNIPLSRDLVAIVGGRGSGKSALAELIAFAGNAEFFKAPREKDLEDAFLRKASIKSARNPSPVTGATITLTWNNGDTSTAVLPATPRHGKVDEKVKYLPQKFVERLCDPENIEEIEREIERVIFQRIPRTDRLGASSFGELRDATTKAIQVKKQGLQSSIAALNRSIYEDFLRVGSKPTKQRELAQKQAELQTLMKNAPVLPAENKADIEELEKLTGRKSELEAGIIRLNEQVSVLETIEARVNAISQQITAFNEEIQELLGRVGLGSEVQHFLLTRPSVAFEVVARRRSELKTEIETLAVGTGEPPLASVHAVEHAIGEVKQRLRLSETKSSEYEKFQSDKRTLEEVISSLNTEIARIDNELAPALVEKRKLRVERYLGYFDILKEERAALEHLYDPLKRALEEGGDTDRRLSFVTRVGFDAMQHAQTGFELMDQRKHGAYEDPQAMEVALKKLMAQIESFDYARDETRRLIREFRETFLKDSTGHAIAFSDQLRRGKTEEDFNNWFYSLEHFTVTYSIKFEDKELQLLSPGQKGMVLLLVYLEVDQEDKRPLIIDQPEDNLDNLSVYSNLISYFRKRKKTRQIIIITHNPNLVVNTDAEQIIAASFDGARHPRIVYTSGALENTNRTKGGKGIREHVCEILEGGTEAFLKREQKYSLP